MDANGAKNVQKYMYMLSNRADGGMGSGNWGHAGRLGIVGGSSGKGQGSGIANRLETPDGKYTGLAGAYKENAKRDKEAAKAAAGGSDKTAGQKLAASIKFPEDTWNEGANVKALTKSLGKVRELASDADAKDAFAEPKYGHDTETENKAASVIKQFPKEWVRGAIENGGKVDLAGSPKKSVYTEVGKTKMLTVGGTPMAMTGAVAGWLVSNNPFLKSYAAKLGANGKQQLINGIAMTYARPSAYGYVSAYLPNLTMETVYELLAAGK